LNAWQSLNGAAKLRGGDRTVPNQKTHRGAKCVERNRTSHEGRTSAETKCYDEENFVGLKEDRKVGLRPRETFDEDRDA